MKGILAELIELCEMQKKMNDVYFNDERNIHVCAVNYDNVHLTANSFRRAFKGLDVTINPFMKAQFEYSYVLRGVKFICIHSTDDLMEGGDEE